MVVGRHSPTRAKEADAGVYSDLQSATLLTRGNETYSHQGGYPMEEGITTMGGGWVHTNGFTDCRERGGRKDMSPSIGDGRSR